MGKKYRKKTSPTKPSLRKSSVLTGAPGAPPRGCPEEVVVVGRGALDSSVLGDPASLTLADDRPQLVVKGRVMRILESQPDLVRVTQCLEQGERYLGTVTEVSADRFEATLARGG